MDNYPNSVLVIAHMYEKSTKGGLPQEEVRNFLLERSERVTYLELPFHYAKVRRAYLTEYQNGKVVKRLRSSIIGGPEWFQYILHFLITVNFLLQTGASYDLCIALDNLTVLPVIPFRRLKLIKRLLYYSIDYTPKRFENKFLNIIYQHTNKIASQNADLNWAVSEAIVSEKEKRGILRDKRCLVVPVGYRGKDIKLPNYKRVDKYHLVFVGILMEKQGVQMILEAMPRLLESNRKIKLTVIGTGDYENELRKLAKKLNLGTKVKFTGYVYDPNDVENILTKAGIGLAPYKPILESFTSYADPGKIKLYLGCGLPIITTSVPKIALSIKNNKAGEVVEYNVLSFVEAVKKITKTHKSYRNRTIIMSKSYDYVTIYNKAFKNSNEIIISE